MTTGAKVTLLVTVALLATGCPNSDVATPAATSDNERTGGLAGPVSGGQPGRVSGGDHIAVVETKEPPTTVRTPSGKDLNVYSNKVEVVADESGKVPTLEATVAVKPAQVAAARPAASSASSSAPTASPAPTAAVAHESGEQPSEAFAQAAAEEAAAAEPVAAESVTATPEEIGADAAPVTVDVADLPTVELLPDTSYVVELREPDAAPGEPAVETVTIHTLADAPVIESVTAPEPGKLVVAIDPQGNPDTTLVSVAVVETASGEIISYVDLKTGTPVKAEERWDPLPAPAAGESMVELEDDSTIVLTGLTLDPETIAVIVQAKNEPGVETSWSDPVGLLSPPMTPEEEADDPWHEENLDVEVDASLVDGASDAAFAEKVVALRDGIKRVRAQEGDLTNELKALRAQLKAAKAAVREGQKIARLLDKSQKATAAAVEDARAALARAEALVVELTQRLQEVKARRLALRDALKTKTAELKALLAAKKAHGKARVAAAKDSSKK